MRLLTLLLAVLLAGCASKKIDQQLDTRSANSRAIEQARMNAISRGDVASERGAEIYAPDDTKVFDPSVARFGRARMVDGKSAPTNEFHFKDRVRTKDFNAKSYTTKGAWLGDAKFATKQAPTKESWFAKRSASTKSYDTKEARDSNKEMAVRALPGGEKPFLVPGRRQADLDANGTAKVPFGTTDLGPSWSGDLKPLSVQDVKDLLNKN